MSKKIFIFAILLAGLSVFYTTKNLQFKTSRSDLIDEKYEFQQRWLNYAKNFTPDEDIVIVVKADDEQNRIKAIQDIEKNLKGDKDFKNFFYKVDKSSLSKKGLYYVPIESLEKVKKQLDGFKQVDMLAGFYVMYKDKSDLFSLSLLEYMKTGQYKSPFDTLLPVNKTGNSVEYMSVENLSFLQVKPKAKNQFDSFSGGVKKVKDAIHSIEKDYPNVRFGITGLPAMEADEMAAAEKSNTTASIVAIVGTIILLLLGYRNIRQSSIVLFCLALAICYCFGVITLTIGHLNILSMFFVPMLIGLGINYGIYVISTYKFFLVNSEPDKSPMEQTMKKIMPSLIGSVLTTAIAFASTYFSPFLGLRDLGIVSAIGIVVCFLTTIVLLPPLLELFDDKTKPEYCYSGTYRQIMLKQKHIFWGLMFLVVGSMFYIRNVNYNRDLLHLQPDTEAVFLEQYIDKKTDYSAWYGISLSESLDECEVKRKKFEAMPGVGKVEGLFSLVPENQDKKYEIIKSMRKDLSGLAEKGHTYATNMELKYVLPDTPASNAVRSQLGLIGKNHVVSEYEDILFSDLNKRLLTFSKMANEDKVSMADLPKSLKDKFVGKDGKIAIHIHSKKNLWIFANLNSFVKNIRKIDPIITGHPIGYYEATLQMEESYKKIIMWSFIGILIILTVLLRNFKHLLLSLIPIAVGIVFTFGVCGLMGIHLNTANVIAFPIILGTGLENGIYIIHEYLKKYKTVPTYATARGTFLACATTIVGFIALVFSSHKGLVGLGEIVSIGMIGSFMGSFILCVILNAISENQGEDL